MPTTEVRRLDSRARFHLRRRSTGSIVTAAARRSAMSRNTPHDI